MFSRGWIKRPVVLKIPRASAHEGSIPSPGTQIAQTVLGLSGGSQQPGRCVSAELVENLRLRVASAIVSSDRTIDCAYAHLGLWFVQSFHRFHLGRPPDQGLVVAIPEMGGPPPHYGQLAALSVRMKHLAMSAWMGFLEEQAQSPHNCLDTHVRGAGHSRRVQGYSGSGGGAGAQGPAEVPAGPAPGSVCGPRKQVTIIDWKPRGNQVSRVDKGKVLK